MKWGEVYIKAGPVFVDGELVFTATRDLLVGDPTDPEDIIRPDGSVPERGEAMTPTEERIFLGEVEFTQ
jgi:hypothetical protein